MWLEHEIAKPFAGWTVVATHHALHPLSVHHRFIDSSIHRQSAERGFVSDLRPLMAQVDLWVHGHVHVHDSFDYRVGRCRVVANPAGYVLNQAVARATTELKVENAGFDSGRVLDVGG